jgi:hypothetical protein
MKLKELPGVCNETMTALWEECKPCLKQTCMKFYARVCRSGSSLIGRQVKRGPACDLGSQWGMRGTLEYVFHSTCWMQFINTGWLHALPSTTIYW